MINICLLEFVYTKISLALSRLFSSKPSLKNRSTIFTLGNRGNVLTSDLESPIIVPHAAQKGEKKVGGVNKLYLFISSCSATCMQKNLCFPKKIFSDCQYLHYLTLNCHISSLRLIRTDISTLGVIVYIAYHILPLSPASQIVFREC